MARKKTSSKVLTRPLTKREAAGFAVFLLGGAGRSVDTEDVAKKAAELLPTAFSWRKYPDQINLELVRAVLSDSKKPQFGSVLHGTGTTGWRLSDAGVVWASRLQEEMESGSIEQGHATPWSGSSDARRADRELGRAKASLAWQQWTRGEQVSVQAAMQLFRIDDYADTKMKDIKVARLRALLGTDENAAKLIELAAKRVLGRE